jgi:hypothetical protein
MNLQAVRMLSKEQLYDLVVQVIVGKGLDMDEVSRRVTIYKGA